MNIKYLLILILVLYSSLEARVISVDTPSQPILRHCSYFIDTTNKLSLKEVREKKFLPVPTRKLSYGYSPPFTVWIRFELHNDSDKTQHLVLNNTHPLATSLTLYDSNKTFYEGLFHVSHYRDTFTPVFPITLKPKEKKRCFLQASSYILPLILDLRIAQEEYFYKNSYKEQNFLYLFFGAMGVLLVYNLFLFLFTRDKSYFYYIVYIFGVTLHHGLYTGFLYIYLSQFWINILAIYGIYWVLGFMLMGLVLFIRSFVKTYQYPKIDKTMRISLYVIPPVMFCSTFGLFNGLEAILFLLIGLFSVFVSIYASYRGNKQAYIIVAGWIALFTAFVSIVLNALGIYNVFIHFPYVIEGAILTEAFIFSIALAQRINSLQNELIVRQKYEKLHLDIKIKEKTKHLNAALRQKDILFTELHHRVKNNLQTIVSLLRIQSFTSEDKKTKETLLSVQNRISAISDFHELVYLHNNQDPLHADAKLYFSSIIEQIQNTYPTHCEVTFDIRTQLDISKLIYCGLILNELASNSFKYANRQDCTLTIRLYEKLDKVYFEISDNGEGYDSSNIQTKTMGLKIVTLLVQEQLHAQVSQNTQNGVSNFIQWERE